MKKTAIVYEQHQEIARIPADKIEYIYCLVDGLRVDTSIKKINGYESYEGDEVEFISENNKIVLSGTVYAPDGFKDSYENEIFPRIKFDCGGYYELIPKYFETAGMRHGDRVTITIEK